ncbi:hypothetical protein KKF91_20030 [Myxococcota bacterium]|nr:hypothetical protein [Myxococcota bacterium]
MSDKPAWAWPFAAPATALKAFEDFMAARGAEWLRDERMLKGAGKTMAASMQAKSQWDRLMEVWMGELHMATSGQMEEMARRVDDVDRRVDQLGERLDEISDLLREVLSALKAPEAAQTKTPTRVEPADEAPQEES